MDLPDYSPASLEHIVEQYADLLLRITFVQLKHMQDAEDITQEVFVRLIEKKPVFESEEHMKAWLIRVAVNLCKDHWKSAWYKRTVPLEEELGFFPAEISDVLQIIMQLPAPSRQVVLLHDYVGYSLVEIAALTGQTSSAVTTRLHRARKKLRLLLEPCSDSGKGEM
jgi:RNA polymerase sigma-70 factor (ECF subfamily)